MTGLFAARGLFLARSHRVEELAELLVHRLAADRPEDPIVPQEVIVGSRGMERWLRHRIATRDEHRLCANVSFLFPEVALSARVAALLGTRPPAEDPWAPDRLAFSVLRVLQERAHEPLFDEVRAWLDADVPGPHDASTPGRGGRAWTLARELADVLDRLTRFRPDLLVGRADRKSLRVAPWLEPLWESLATRLRDPETGLDLHFAARLAALEALPSSVGPPHPTLRVFGVSALPPATLRTLHQLGRHGRVELFAFVPSTQWWADFRGHGEARALARRYRDEGRDELLATLRAELSAQHPLLTSLGRLSRDFQAVVETSCEGYEELEAPALLVRGAAPTSLLAYLHDDLRDAAPPPDPKRALASEDRSVQIHACYGALRQVELLRDLLLRLFDDDPTLRPRDVLVMTPSLATYAPLVGAVFGAGRDQPRGADWGPTGAPRLPVTVADLGLRSLNPVADALLRLLAFADGRLTATGVAELLALQPVRERFGLAATELEQVRRWLSESGLRWAADASERAVHGQPADEANTLLFALKRLARGVVEADDPSTWDGGVVPVDDLEGGEVVALGRLLQFLRTLTAQAATLRGARSAAAWVPLLEGVVQALTSTDADAAFLTAQVLEELRELSSSATQAGCEVPLRLAAIRRWLEGRFERPLRGDRPIQGAITLSTLSPMRSVPYPVIVLLGLDDGVFPRSPTGLGFDPIRAHPRVGDRDARDEDRHLFLEALLSARRHFVAIYTGHDERTREKRPPAVPLAELLDTIDAGWHAEAGPKASERVTTHHPLQPFSADMFAPAPGRTHAPTYGGGMRTVAEALAGPAIERKSPLLFRPGDVLDPPRLPPGVLPELSLRELIDCVRQPAKALLRRRLRLSLGDWDERLLDREPVELEFLENFQLQYALLADALLAPALTDELRASLLARYRGEGRLPLGGLGERHFERSWATICAPIEASRALREGVPERVVVDRVLRGCRLKGEVDGIYGEARLVRLFPEPPEAPRILLATWVELLAVAVERGAPAEALLVGAAKDKAVIKVLRSPADPARHLEALVELAQRALVSPLPLSEKCTAAFARASRRSWAAAGDTASGDAPLPPETAFKALEKANEAWSGAFERGEAADPYLSCVFGALGPHRVDPTDETATEAFETEARRLWSPIFQAEGKP